MVDLFSLASPTLQIHSSQVYSYYSDERTFDIMDTFIKGLGAGATPCNNSIQLKGLLQDIFVKKAELVVFSCDMEIAKNIKCADDLPLDYWEHATRAFGKLYIITFFKFILYDNCIFYVVCRTFAEDTNYINR